MTTPAFERLRKILELEEKQAFRNRAVVGGLPAMCDRWAADAENESADGNIVSAVVLLLKRYPQLDKDNRPQCIATMHEVLDGNLSGLDAWQEPMTSGSDASNHRDGVADERVTSSDGSPMADLPAGTRRGLDAIQEEPQAAPADADSEEEAKDDSSGSRTTNAKSSSSVEPAGPTDQAEKTARKKRKSKVKRSPHELQSSVELLNGVGPALSQTLSKVGINQIIDFFWHLPTRYDDYSQMSTIAELEPGEQATVIANLWDIRERKVGMNRQMVQGILGDSSGTLHATWWNKYVAQKLTVGSTMRFSGKVGLYMGQKTLDNPSFEELDTDMVETGRLTPVYRLTEGLSSKRLRGLVKTVLDEFGQFISDPLPKKLCQKYELPNLSYSLRQVHFPSSKAKMEEARRRLVFEELLYIQLGIQRRRHAIQQLNATSLTAGDGVFDKFRDSLPFPLTAAQERAIDEIIRDVARTVPMTRLVQGDVGSGKTAVAAAAMFVAATNGVQSAMLAPTQILAEQHYRGIRSLLENLHRSDGSPLRIALLTGRVGGKERTEIQNDLRAGEIDILVGTTAIIQDEIQFNNLGFAVVDEQHRFGVEQRGALRSGNHRPHLLVMSATPIPRSLALTIYGDLDISIIDEMPPGRTPVKTKWFMPTERERVYSFLKREIRDGRQGFIVYPLVEESDKLDAGSAVAAYERLSSEVFPNERLALLHGRMSGSEKDEVMTAFANGEYDILVSTTVIEVGIDVPNASLIIIEDADRFGLAQLHQLRGRVGRGQHASYCALVSKGQSANAEERLVALQESNDGFVLAQKDLDMRGPGDFFGTQQSGLPDLRVAHLTDVELVSQSQNAANELLSDDPTLREYPQLSRQIERFWRGHGDIS